ncbi:capsular biosynthesis protein [Solibacillus sp. R5-41]|uniref:YveK family protein n=1 Tax=Solibacillus sp. R5-41 TaxID=2048654 RepID=UPI000C1259A7|nr:Wzz/FepE/Etk N-terminal domain-containing protein [Solibacillus sp. R5-41]ATP39445.1 capsular biosynthesis protein [Solibacillus sp. R5-41]
MEERISLLEIAKIIKKRLVLIVILTVISVGIAAGISFYVLTPIYEAQTQILVNQKSNSEEAYSWSQMETDLQLINTYNVIITSPVILNKVIEKQGINILPETLKEQITLTNESNSKVINIIVEDSSSQQAVEISNTVAEVFKEEIPKLMNVDNINILSVAKLSENPTPVKPNKMRNIAIAAVIGLMLGIGLAFLFEFLDTTIKNEKDIEDIVGLPVMGVVGLIAKEKKSLLLRRVRRN